MNKWLCSVAVVLGIGVSVSEAQSYSRPATNPYIRPGTEQYYSPYQGGNYYGPLLGNTAALRPNPSVGTVIAPGGLTPDATGSQSLSSFGGGVLNPVANDYTGHATRFNSYSRYFSNQGGAYGTNSPTDPSSRLNAIPGTDTRRSITAGSRPLRGRSNTTQP